MFEDDIPVYFLNILKGSKVSFNCHSWELYAFLESSSPAILKNITSIVLGSLLTTKPMSESRTIKGIPVPGINTWKSNPNEIMTTIAPEGPAEPHIV
jgi:hypothetical protein